jgi:hypothetical protein
MRSFRIFRIAGASHGGDAPRQPWLVDRDCHGGRSGGYYVGTTRRKSGFGFPRARNSGRARQTLGSCGNRRPSRGTLITVK